MSVKLSDIKKEIAIPPFKPSLENCMKQGKMKYKLAGKEICLKPTEPTMVH